MAAGTQRSRIGPSVTNPYTRHPALTAAAIATVDELSGGRAVLALGAGGGLEQFGIDRVNPVGALREAIQIIRGLTAGEKVDFAGRHFTVNGAQLGFDWRRQIPVYIAARGPRILELAGEVADGVIIGGFAQPAGLKYALDRVVAGLDRAGRGWADIDVVAWLYTCVSDDREAARRAVSRMVMASVITSRTILDQLGIVLPAELADRVAQRSLDLRGGRDAGRRAAAARGGHRGVRGVRHGAGVRAPTARDPLGRGPPARLRGPARRGHDLGRGGHADRV